MTFGKSRDYSPVSGADLTYSARHFIARRYLNAIATHKDFLKRGVATALLNWGIGMAEKDDLPIVLEAVPEIAPVYARSGFKQVGRFVLDYAVKDGAGKPTGETDAIRLSIMVREPSL